MTIDTNTVPLTTLAQAIVRDTLRGRQQRDVSPTCFACGHAFDAGAPAWQPPLRRRHWDLVVAARNPGVEKITTSKQKTVRTGFFFLLPHNYFSSR